MAERDCNLPFSAVAYFAQGAAYLYIDDSLLSLFQLQNYNNFRQRLGDSRRNLAIEGHFIPQFLRLPQLLYDCPNLSWCEPLAGDRIAHRLQLLPQAAAAVYPCHEVAHCCTWHATGEIHQRQLLLRVCANKKTVLHINS